MLVEGLLLAMTATTANMGYWCTDSLQNVFKDTPCPAIAARTLNLSAARGQAATAQVVLTAGNAPGRVLKVSMQALKRTDGPGGISARAFSSAFVEYHRVTKNSTETPAEELLRKAPADFPDAFLQTAQCDLKPGECQPVWVCVDVPRTARAGAYSGTVSVETDTGTLKIPLNLEVYGFTFPRETRLLVTIWTDHYGLGARMGAPYTTEGYWPLLRRVARLMRQHHQNVIMTPWDLITAEKDSSGKVRFDYSSFDRWAQTFLDEGFKKLEISHVGSREHGKWDDKTFVPNPFPCMNIATGQQETLQPEEWLPALQEHLKQKGWLGISMIHVADEPIAANRDSWRELSRRVHALAPDLRRLDAVHVPDLAGDLEVMVPQLNYLSDWENSFHRAQADGTELWYYVAWVPQGHFPNRLLDYPLVKTRVQHWMNYLSGATGYLHWGFNFWSQDLDQQYAPGDNWIVWTGKDTPRSSLRYEAMREGIEDYEYLCLLQEGAAGAARRLGERGFDARAWVLRYVDEVSPGYENYTRDPAVMLETRDAVARAIVAVSSQDFPVLAAAERKGDEIVVSGRARPGAEVRTADARARCGADGSFRLHTQVRGRFVTVTAQSEGRQTEIPVPVQDAGGETHTK